MPAAVTEKRNHRLHLLVPTNKHYPHHHHHHQVRMNETLIAKLVRHVPCFELACYCKQHLIPTNLYVPHNVAGEQITILPKVGELVLPRGSTIKQEPSMDMHLQEVPAMSVILDVAGLCGNNYISFNCLCVEMFLVHYFSFHGNFCRFACFRSLRKIDDVLYTAM